MDGYRDRFLSPRLLRGGLVVLLLLLAPVLFFNVYTLFFDAFSMRIFKRGDARFMYGVQAARTGLERKAIDRVLPESMFDRVSFPLADGGEVLVVFRHGIDDDLQRTIAEMPDVIQSYDQLSPLKRGLILSFGTYDERYGYDWIDGYEWKGYKEGVLREQLRPEQIPPTF